MLCTREQRSTLHLALGLGLSVLGGWCHLSQGHLLYCWPCRGARPAQPNHKSLQGTQSENWEMERKEDVGLVTADF